MSQVVGLPNNSYKHITNTAWVRARLCELQKWCTRLAAASDKVYQLFAHGRWHSPGIPASSTTKTGRHDIAKILLKVALNSKNQNQSKSIYSNQGSGGSMSQVVGLPNNSYKPITNTAWVRSRVCKLQKGCTRLAAKSDNVYQQLVHGWWFSPGIPASSSTKTGRHDIAEILHTLFIGVRVPNHESQRSSI